MIYTAGRAAQTNEEKRQYFDRLREIDKNGGTLTPSEKEALEKQERGCASFR